MPASYENLLTISLLTFFIDKINRPVQSLFENNCGSHELVKSFVRLNYSKIALKLLGHKAKVLEHDLRGTAPNCRHSVCLEYSAEKTVHLKVRVSTVYVAYSTISQHIYDV